VFVLSIHCQRVSDAMVDHHSTGQGREIAVRLARQEVASDTARK